MFVALEICGVLFFFAFSLSDFIPIDTDANPRLFSVIYVLSCIIIIHVLMIMTQLHHLSGCLFSFLSNEFVVLGKRYERIFDGLEDNIDNDSQELVDKIERSLNENAIQHQKLVDLTSTLQQIFSATTMTHFITSAILFSFLTYQVFVESKYIFSMDLLNSLFFLTYAIWELFLYTLCGEELREASLGIKESIYKSKWYNLRYNGIHYNKYKSFRSSIILTLTRANKEIVIKAGGIFSLSYETFTNIVRFSTALLTLIIEIQRK
ncbi:unnamed protein product [Diamesa hyperborea]